MRTVNLAAGFFHRCREQPLRTALVVDGTSHSYGQLGELVRAVAGWIANRTGRRAPRVAVLASRSLEAYAGVLAAAWSGASFIPLSPQFPLLRLRETLSAAMPDALIVDRSGLARLADGLIDGLPTLSPVHGAAGSAALGIDGPDGLRHIPPLASPASATPRDMAYLMFTSGTTGRPKGIPISAGNLRHLLGTLQARYQIGPEDRLSQFFDLTFDLAVFDIFMAFGHGASLHVVPENQLAAPAAFIRREELTVWFSVPSLVGMLARMKILKAEMFPSLRLSLFCGEPLTVVNAEAWKMAAPRSILDNLYGPTEATVVFMAQRYGGAGSVTEGRGLVAIGTPLAGLRAAILDRDLGPLPAGEEGELALSGPQVARGYWRDPTLTRRRFLAIKDAQPGKGKWYLTGDRAYRDSSGTYHFLGRVDNQVKVRGYRVELEDVEHHLRRASAVENVAAVVLRGEGSGEEELVGVVEGAGTDSATLLERMAAALPRYMVPRRIVSLGVLPRGLSGKIDRRRIERLLLDLPEPDEGTLPSGRGSGM